MPQPPRPSWYVISLRPRGEHRALRRAAARHGAGLIALSPWALQSRDDPSTRHALRCALGAPMVVFTSPAAVRAAARLQTFKAKPRQQWLAVGASTAAALRRAGVEQVMAPQRMDSEGLLALPPLQAVAGQEVGLVTAPGGRDLLAPTLQARGARVLRADVYARVPVMPTARALAAMRTLDKPAVVLASSGEALQQSLQRVPADVAERLRGLRVIVASARLAELARAIGFADVGIAAGPRPSDLLAVAAP